MKVHSFNYFAVIILSLFLSNFAFAEGQRADDSSILDIDASGEVDAMTDGLLMMRSMFGFTDDVLVDGAVAENCTECDSAQIQAHISRVRSATIAQLNSSGEPEPDETEGPFGTFIGIYSEGSITPSGNEAGPEGLFEVASPTTLQNDLEVMGSTTFKGSTTFEGSTTFTLPSSERFYVDGFTEVTDLRVQDSADISNLEASEIIVEDLEASEIIVEDLNVTNYSDLSYLNVDHDAIFAGPATFNSNLEVMGSTTFKGSTTFEGSTTFTLPSSERFYVDGFTEVTDLRVQDSADISNLEASEIIVEDLNVTNYSDLSYLNVDHDAIFAGPATFKSTLEVRGSANISRLDVRDSFAMNASLRWLNVEQTATFAGPATFKSDLEVMGSTTFRGSTTFKGSTTFEGSTTFPGPATFNSSLEVRGSADISRLDVRDSFAMNASLRWLNVEQTATFAGPATFKSNLDVMGSTNLGSLNVSQNATFAQDVYVANTLTAQELTQESDKRIKKDITPTKYDLNNVLNLNPVDYKLKSNDKDQIGFIAQEVRDVIPELVNGVEGDLEKGETLSINYIGLIPVLTKAIQEQQSQIDNQATTIDALLERIIALEKSNNP